MAISAIRFSSVYRRTVPCPPFRVTPLRFSATHLTKNVLRSFLSSQGKVTVLFPSNASISRLVPVMQIIFPNAHSLQPTCQL